MTSSTDTAGNVTTNVYDAGGRRTSVTNALGQVTSFTYDANGNQLTMTDALSRTTTFAYDELNRRTITYFALDSSVPAFPAQTTQVTTYDELGRRIAQQDQDGKITKFDYDKLGRLVGVIDALGQRTGYGYDEVGNQIAQIDAKARTTRYAYDAIGRRVQRTLPIGQVESMAYDAAGNLASRTDFNGRTSTFGYDVMNRLISKAPDPSLAEPTVSFTYQPTGQRATMTDALGLTTYNYDARNRLVTKAGRFGTLNYSYAAGGGVGSIASGNVNGTRLSYAYDALNRLQTVNDLNVGNTGYAYDGVGNLASIAAPNGVTHNYQYTPLNRLKRLDVTAPLTGAVASYTYTLGNAGHRLSAAESLRSASAIYALPTTITRSVQYAYDSLYRLTGETIATSVAPPNGGPPAPGPSGTINYGYDEVGNRLTRNSTVNGVLGQSLAYDNNDRLGGDSYDANGNTTSGTVSDNAGAAPTKIASTTFTYDDRVKAATTSLSGAPTNVQYVYDGDGNRVSEIRDGQVISFLVDDLNPTGYAQVLEEVTGAGNSVQRAYTWGQSLIAMSAVMSGGGWQTTFYGFDGHGNIRLLFDATGAITDRYDYEAFGALIYREGINDNRHLYCAERFDAPLGQYYLRARTMNPLTGRFWNMDQYAGDHLDPSSLHKYLYAGVNPANALDPSGRFEIADLQAAISTIVTIARIALPAVISVARNVGFNLLRATLRPFFVAVGGLALRQSERFRPVPLLEKFLRFFRTPNASHPPVDSSQLGTLIKSAFPNVQQGHIFIQRSWYRAGSASQWYPNDQFANRGMQRLGNAGFNLLAIPNGINNAFSNSAALNIGYAGGVGLGSVGVGYGVGSSLEYGVERLIELAERQPDDPDNFAQINPFEFY